MATNSIGTKSITRKRTARLVLKETLDIAGSGELHATLKKYAAKGTNVNLNGSKVETIDTTALQLLLAFTRQVRANGHSVQWQSASETLLKTAALTGLTTALELAEAAA